MRLEYTPICFSETRVQLRHEFFRLGSQIACGSQELVKHHLHQYRQTERLLSVLDEQLIGSVKIFEVWIHQMTLVIDISGLGKNVHEGTAVYGKGFVVSGWGWYDPEVIRSRVQVVANWLSEKLEDEQSIYLTKKSIQELAGYHDDFGGRT